MENADGILKVVFFECHTCHGCHSFGAICTDWLASRGKRKKTQKREPMGLIDIMLKIYPLGLHIVLTGVPFPLWEQGERISR